MKQTTIDDLLERKQELLNAAATIDTIIGAHGESRVDVPATPAPATPAKATKAAKAEKPAKPAKVAKPAEVATPAEKPPRKPRSTKEQMEAMQSNVLSALRERPTAKLGTLASELGADKLQVAVILRKFVKSGEVVMAGTKSSATYSVVG